MIRPNKTIMFVISLLCVAVLFAVIAVPALLAYEWLHPVNFWERFAFGASLLGLLSLPFGQRTPKPTVPKQTNTYDVRPTSLLHREIRDAVHSYGLAKRQIN